MTKSWRPSTKNIKINEIIYNKLFVCDLRENRLVICDWAPLDYPDKKGYDFRGQTGTGMKWVQWFW